MQRLPGVTDGATAQVTFGHIELFLDLVEIAKSEGRLLGLLKAGPRPDAAPACFHSGDGCQRTNFLIQML